MKFARLILLIFSLLSIPTTMFGEGWIRVNEIGYLPKGHKVAVYIDEDIQTLKYFDLCEAKNGKKVARFKSLKAYPSYGQMKSCYRLDFSTFETPGIYLLKAGNAEPKQVKIDAHAYDGTADFLLNYMRQQRCGYNPYIKDSCHTHDGFIEYHPTKTGQHIDVRGGWHDAADYLQYTNTSANAVYQMMYAYEQNPGAFADRYNANGHSGPNGIPDILDEAIWGMQWLCRMNPEPGDYYNQIGDDRDHAGMRLPSKDSVDYGYGRGTGRPVYYVSGEPQQQGKGKNITTGRASTAGKFASCFAFGSRILKPFAPQLAKDIALRAEDAYQTGQKYPGYTQTASVKSPYIYEETNWVDDMELAAMELYAQTGNPKYLEEAAGYGRQEPITPWIGADTARHYQWYPFMNMGHVRIAAKGALRQKQEFLRNLKTGIERTWYKAQNSVFLNGIPYIWCSNNLCTAMLTQCRSYRLLSGDESYIEMENALLDWLFGCNPWGVSMVVEMPKWADYPDQPHSAFSRLGMGNATGGLVDGPVYSTIFGSLLGVDMRGLPDKPAQTYDKLQPDEMVYHDATGDYSTNEPTMDGTACLTYYLSAMQMEGQKQAMNLLKGTPKELKAYLKDSLQSLTARCEQTLKAAYMTEEYLETHTDLPGWEGFPVKLYRYHTGKDVRVNKKKEALVYLLNPSAEQLARWIVYAVWDAKGHVSYEDVEKVRKHILYQSGAQFPVSGVVYEAMYEAGHYEPYVFRDGVTVYVSDPSMMPEDGNCTETQLKHYLNLKDSDLKDYTGRYARICSTTREMYYAAGGQRNVGLGCDGFRSPEWLLEVRRLYQEAWNSERNFLIYAWAHYNL